MKSEIVKLGKLEINLDELAEFLVEAKKKGFAGGGEYKDMSDDSKKFSCQRENFYFSDEYMGELQFPGHEIVRWKTKSGQPIWRMNYFGGVLPEFLDDKKIVKMVEDVLRPALMQVTPESPFRGPGSYFSDIGVYTLPELKGDIKRFIGKEEIGLIEVDKKYRRGGSTGRYPVYELFFHGGLIIPK